MPAGWFIFDASCRDLQPGVNLATRKHIEWLLEGVESWNERRKRDGFRPDLAGVDIYEEFRKAGKINNDGNLHLCRIDLNRANLTESRLCCDFTGGGADLRWSNHWFANLADSQLSNSKFDGRWGAFVTHIIWSCLGFCRYLYLFLTLTFVY